MSSEPTQRQDGSFIIRIWWEQGSAPRQSARWRGWVQHVRNGEHFYFPSLRDLTDFIAREVGVHPVDDQEPQGLV